MVLDNLSTGRRSNLDSALAQGSRLVVEDFRDAALVRSLLEQEKPEVVFHLGAQIDVRVSAAKPAYDAEINVLGTINMLEAARLCGARRFVFTSTGGVPNLAAGATVFVGVHAASNTGHVSFDLSFDFRAAPPNRPGPQASSPALHPVPPGPPGGPSGSIPK